ncbi:hypothetical protein C8Q78DRAFT_1004986, partial [Trametes maxima]
MSPILLLRPHPPVPELSTSPPRSRPDHWASTSYILFQTAASPVLIRLATAVPQPTHHTSSVAPAPPCFALHHLRPEPLFFLKPVFVVVAYQAAAARTNHLRFDSLTDSMCAWSVQLSSPASLIRRASLIPLPPAGSTTPRWSSMCLEHTKRTMIIRSDELYGIRSTYAVLCQGMLVIKKTSDSVNIQVSFGFTRTISVVQACHHCSRAGAASSVRF